VTSIKPPEPGIRSAVLRFFEFGRHETTIYTEVVAGVSTFLALAYIFVVNSAILGQSGIDPRAVLFATVVASFLGTLFMGLWAKLPFAVAPGLEMNGLFSFVACKEMGLTWQQGLAIVFMSGVLNVVFTRFQIRRVLADSIPPGLKRALATTVGAFVATIGLQLAHVIQYRGGFLDVSSISVAASSSHEAIILCLGCLISAALYVEALSFPLGMFVSIIVCTVLAHIWGVGVQNSAAPGSLFAATFQLDLSVFEHLGNLRYWSLVVVFFVIDFIGGAGKLIGLTALTDIQDDRGHVRNLKRALYVDGGATIVGSLLGTSSLVAFVESSVGIRAGGRTGLTAVVCAVLIAGAFWFYPVLRVVPPVATTGVMVFIGYLLLPWKIDPAGSIKHTTADTWIGIAMAAVALCTFGIDKAMALGFWFYFFKSDPSNPNATQRYWLGAVALLLTVTSVLQYIDQ
jgi:AGZA family xanthine/uracil permease-like MFS transporter